MYFTLFRLKSVTPTCISPEPVVPPPHDCIRGWNPLVDGIISSQFSFL